MRPGRLPRLPSPHISPIFFANTLGDHGTLSVRNLSNTILKTPPATVMAVGVVFVLSAAEIVALLGDHGAGKSTVDNILSDTHAPATGSSRLEGRLADRRDARGAGAHGIEVVRQNVSVAGRQPVCMSVLRRGSRVDTRTVAETERVAMIPGVG